MRHRLFGVKNAEVDTGSDRCYTRVIVSKKVTYTARDFGKGAKEASYAIPESMK